MDQLAAQKILPHKFLTGRGMLNDGSLSRNRRKADENSLRLTDYAVPFAPGSIDTGSLFEFIEYFIFVNSKGLTIECMTDLFYPKPYAYEINFCESVLYGDYLITELKLDRPDSWDFALYEGFKVSNHLTWIQKHGQHYTLLEIRGWKMHSIQIPTNFQPEDEDKHIKIIYLMRDFCGSCGRQCKT